MPVNAEGRQPDELDTLDAVLRVKKMQQKLATLIERFPDHEAIIRALAGRNTRFRTLVQDHHDVHCSLARAERNGDPATTAELEQRYKNLEEEMIRMIQAYPIA